MSYYKKLTATDLIKISGFVPRNRILWKNEINEEYSHDELTTEHYYPEMVVKINSTQEVSNILKYANEHKIAVTVRGAGTGLVGAAVALKGGIVLDMTMMNHFLELDEENLTLTVEPGVLLMDLASYVEEKGFFYPPDPGEKSATIGGNISTNAGGMRAVKYGVTRDYVRAIEVVLADGSIVEFGGKVVKNSSGYDLKDLIIGSEGTLGIVTKIVWWYLVQTQGRAVADPQALAFLTGYLIEKALAVDNVFVWLMLFSYFAVPPALQRRVLVYGVLGAIVLRTIMIFAGSWLISQFDWLLYVFGAFLLFTGVKMALAKEDDSGIGDKPLVRWIRSHLRMTDKIESERFFTRKNGVLFATPLLLVLILVELSDVIFAVDSIPAIFAVTTDPFIVLTSNLFAILGLRAMYFLLAGVAERFSMLKYGLSVILVFIGVKMLIVDFYHIPVAISLGVVGGILAVTLLINAWVNRQHDKQRKLPE